MTEAARIKAELKERRERKLTEVFQFVAMTYNDREMYRRAEGLAQNETLGIVTAKLWLQWIVAKQKNIDPQLQKQLDVVRAVLDGLETPESIEPARQPCEPESVKVGATDGVQIPPASVAESEPPSANVIPIESGLGPEDDSPGRCPEEGSSAEGNVKWIVGSPVER